MAMESTTFWEALEHEMELAEPLPQEAKEVLARRGYERRWMTASAEEAFMALGEASALARDVMAVYGGSSRESQQRGKVSNPQTNKVSNDQRWPLWRELMQVRLAADGHPLEQSWEPLRFYLVHDSSASPIGNKRIEISFDWRMPRAALEHELAKAWRHMTKQGWVRPSKPLSRRLAEIVRFNCLVLEPDTPWRVRLERWNAQCTEDEAFTDVRAFERAFRRAELQLTGQKWGLAWFYDELVRSGRLAKLNKPEGRDLLKQGSQRVIEMYRELYDPSFMQPPEWFAQVYEDADEEERRPDHAPLHWAKRMDSEAMRYEQDWGTET